jgi:hypothetical protein
MRAERDIPPTERIAEYLDDLLARYPDLSELDEDAVGDSPWTDGPLTHRASGRVVSWTWLGMKWEKPPGRLRSSQPAQPDSCASTPGPVR